MERSSAYNHQSVRSVERMVQTVKQIMTRKPDNMWLAMLIFKATYIPSINKSPAELWPIHFITKNNSGCSVWVNVSTRRQVHRLPLGYEELHCTLGMCNPEPSIRMTKYS